MCDFDVLFQGYHHLFHLESLQVLHNLTNVIPLLAVFIKSKAGSKANYFTFENKVFVVGLWLEALLQHTHSVLDYGLVELTFPKATEDEKIRLAKHFQALGHCRDYLIPHGGGAGYQRLLFTVCILMIDADIMRGKHELSKGGGETKFTKNRKRVFEIVFRSFVFSEEGERAPAVPFMPLLSPLAFAACVADDLSYGGIEEVIGGSHVSETVSSIVHQLINMDEEFNMFEEFDMDDDWALDWLPSFSSEHP